MVWIQATRPGLLVIFQEEHLVNDGDFVLELKFHQGPAHPFADVSRVDGLTPEYHSETDEC